MKLLNVCVGLDMRQSGGYAERAFQMSKTLARSKVESVVLTMDIDLSAQRIEDIRPAKVIVLKTINKRFNFPLGGLLKVFKSVKAADIVHLMGHWYVINVMAYIAIKYYRKPYVVCPAGALPLFGRSKLLKKTFNLLVGKRIIRDASVGIAVVEDEIKEFDSYGNSNVVVIPNAIHENDYKKIESDSFRRKFNLTDSPIILFMGRLNRIKGPDLLLDAYVKGVDSIGEFQLVFAGSDEGMLDNLLKKTIALGIDKKVKFIGHISGDDKLNAYYESCLLVVPSRMEAMSLVAIEAGICKTPVLVTDQCGLNDVGEVSMHMISEANADSLSECLAKLLANRKELAEFGEHWYKLVVSTYSWKTVVKQYISLFDQILEDNSKI